MVLLTPVGPLESTSVLIRNGSRISGSFLYYVSFIPVKNSFIFSEFPQDYVLKTRLSVNLLIWKCFYILVQVKLLFTWTVLHSAPFWKWEFLELGYGLIGWGIKFSLSETRRVSLSRNGVLPSVISKFWWKYMERVLHTLSYKISILISAVFHLNFSFRLLWCIYSFF